MRPTLVALCCIVSVVLFGCAGQAPDHNPVINGQDDSAILAKGGFDQFGYNYNARIFQGKADGVDRVLGNGFWGDLTYGNDHLVMKWSQEWDAARFNGAPWSPGAWTTNHWNGQAQGGSGEVWHYKIIWVGPDLMASPYWRDGGYPIWGQFEVIFSHGTVGNQHFWDAHARPNGLGPH